jgi:anti-sigma factor RsiW
MKPFEEQFTAWVDGQLSGDDLAEFEKELAQHPDAATEKAAAQKLTKLLREHPTAPALTNAEFFNLQIQQQLTTSEAPGRAPGKPAGWFFSLPRLILAGAACLLVAGLLFKTLIPTKDHSTALATSPYFAQVIEMWPSEPGIWANAVYNPEQNVTVVWLDGLDYIPASYELK